MILVFCVQSNSVLHVKQKHVRSVVGGSFFATWPPEMTVKQLQEKLFSARSAEIGIPGPNFACKSASMLSKPYVIKIMSL